MKTSQGYKDAEQDSEPEIGNDYSPQEQAFDEERERAAAEKAHTLWQAKRDLVGKLWTCRGWNKGKTYVIESVLISETMPDEPTIIATLATGRGYTAQTVKENYIEFEATTAYLWDEDEIKPNYIPF